MAAAPLESSSPPPDATPSDSTRSPGDSMEEIDPQSTRKRPRLDSGSGACESWSTPNETSPQVSQPIPDAPAVADQEAPVSNRPASRMTINMKSPSTIDRMASAPPEESLAEQPDPGPEPSVLSTGERGTNASNAVSLSSSPAPSPEIEVAELEDMDQDPSTTSWKSLGSALQDPLTPDVVQLHEPLSLTETFPKLRPNQELRENLEEICTIIEKGLEHDTTVLLAVKHWLDDVVNGLDQLTHETFLEDREFWDELPILVEYLLRRVEEFHPDDSEGFWRCLEEFFLDFARLALHLIQLDTLLFSQFVEEPELQVTDLISRPYISSLGWFVQVGGIPFFRTMHRKFGPEIPSMVARICDRIIAPPLNSVQQLSEYTSCILALITRCPQLASLLALVLTVTQNLAESGAERKKLDIDHDLVDSAAYEHAMERVHDLIRTVDKQYQAHITKKSPWVTSDISDSIIRPLSYVYLALCHKSPDIAWEIANDLSIPVPGDVPPEDLPFIVLYGWKFGVLKKHIMEGRMELRVHGIEAMQQDFVSVWRQYIHSSPVGVDNVVVQFLVKFLRENKIVEYIVGVESHPQLISRSSNIVGFLVVTGTYTDGDTDTIWRAVTESPDPRTVSEVLAMLVKTFHMHVPSSPALIYLCSKLVDLPLARFDARVVDFCEQLLHYIREKYHDRHRHEILDMAHVDVIPLRLCVRLIRESAAAEDLPLEHKALLQKFASSQLSSFMDVGLSDMDKMETYERCVQDISEMNQFTVGSIQALNALLPNHDSQEIRKLAMDFNLTFLVISEMAHVVDNNQTDFTDTFLRNGFLSRVQMLARLIDGVPDSITDELGTILWQQIFMSKSLVQQGRRALWDMLCGLTRHSTKENPFIDHCIRDYFPKLSPAEDYFPEVLSVPGMDRIWNLILTAPVGSIEADATVFAIEVYLDHNIIHRSPRSAVEATHMALVDRCVDQLKSAASKLKSYSHETTSDAGESMVVEASEDEVRTEELRFSRSLVFLRQFLQGLRTRPRYSPPQNSPPELPTRPLKGEPINIRYQAFDGGSHSKVRSLQIGDLSTASEFVETLVKVTGFSKLKTIYGGRGVDLLEKGSQTLRELKLGSGLLIVRRDPNSREVAEWKRQSLTSVDAEVLKHFDDLYDLLGLDDHLAREIYDFLVVFPPQEKVLHLVKSIDKTEQDMFPLAKPYSFLYSVNALSKCLQEEALEPSFNEAFVSHSVRVLVAALTRPEMSESLADSPTKISFAMSLVECLLYALMVKPPVAEESPLIPDSTKLVSQLSYLVEVGRNLPASQFPEVNLHKLICYSFAVFIEGSVRDPGFWAAIKEQVPFAQFIFSLLLEESRQPIRKGISDNIAIVCSPSKIFKKPSKFVSSESQETREAAISENPARVDILATIWDAFVLTFPRALEFATQSQEFFEIAHSVFSSVAEKSPRDLIFSEYLKQWSGIMLSHRTTEFVGREPVDHLIFGFSRLLKACLDIATSSKITVDTFDLAESLFDTYLFPDLSMPSSEVLVPQTPVMHTQTRQELYAILGLLSRHDENYSQLIERLEDIIPQDYTYSPAWCFDRQKMIRSSEGYAGLKNLSNTCYMNSLLSQLFMNVGFRDFMLRLDLTDSTASQKLLDETKKVFGHMQESWLKSVDPQAFVDTIRTYDNEPVDVTIQMDVDEFYNLLFDRWEAQISNPEDKKKFRSFYGGQLVQQIKSKECPHISERLEPFSAIQCDIKGKADLEESLQAYVEGEIMQGDNKYSCTSCGRHVDAVKRACLKDVPDNLIFHLKRFDFDMVTMMRSKINDEFQFPDRIDMMPFTVEHLSDQNCDNKDDVFELVGVLVHSGTAESGHYYSYIRERPTMNGRGSWVEFNDSDVSRFDPSRIAEQCFGGYSESLHSSSVGQVRFNKVWNAYMLFYQRISSMDSAKSIYQPTKNQYPVHVPLPVRLANHIAMDNEIFVRTYCLLDPYYTLFVRYLLTQFNETKMAESSEGSKLDKSVISIALDTLEQLVSRTREPAGLDGFLAEILRVIKEIPKGSSRVLQWIREKPCGIRNLVLKSPHASMRNGSLRLFVSALSRLRDYYNTAEDGSLEKEKWHTRYLDGLENTVATVEGLWQTLHTFSRSWDDYFEFLLLLASFGGQEVGVILNNNFLLKCLEIVWIDQEDSKRLKKQYFAYFKLLEKGRKYSHRKLMDLLSALLAKIDLTVPPLPDDEREQLPNGKFSLTVTESDFIRTLGRDKELIFLKKILQQHSSPQACRTITSFLIDADSDAGLTSPICKVLEDGLRVAPAELCAPFLEATLIFCRRSSEEDKIIAMIDYVTKGVETIGNSGGKEHLAFFTNLMSSRNERLGLSDGWFLLRVTIRIPDWVPTLLIFPDRAVRNMTMEVLRRILFSGEAAALDDDWQARHTDIAKELVFASIEKLRKTYLTVPGCNVEARAVEAIRTVVDHCLVTYFDDSEEDQKIVHQTQAVITAIEELAVELPEELASESDVPSPEEWEDNSMMASDSEMGLAGSP
ncbi:hypothetical protein ARAM_004521 [Aspergillus rambellii]|uniref:USP domain-containing protein n=1 Tax=Aspergillus rambellii TaxID=308745 RepID=A0A0F8UF16_9EURO|nr:hypothetical protein ARAM_004521 [Aspergillus rambellii]